MYIRQLGLKHSLVLMFLIVVYPAAQVCDIEDKEVFDTKLNSVLDLPQDVFIVFNSAAGTERAVQVCVFVLVALVSGALTTFS